MQPSTTGAPAGNRTIDRSAPVLVEHTFNIGQAVTRDSNVAKTFTFTVADEHAPALRSVVDEMTSLIGSRLDGQHRFAKETALTDAAICVGKLRAAVFAQVPQGDPNYV